jgi:hypothetical protein
MNPKEAGFKLLINRFEGRAIPEEPIPGIEPKSESYKLPKPYKEYGELEILCENETVVIKRNKPKNAILFFI